MKYKYPAIRYWQVNSANNEKAILCITAPCDEIVTWSGIPRKSEAVAIENTSDFESLAIHGYQREQDKKRIKSLVEFYGSPDNIIPTSVLLAVRDFKKIEFTPLDNDSQSLTQIGHVEIDYDLDENAPMNLLYGELASLLEKRNPELKNIKISSEIVSNYKNKAINYINKEEEQEEDGVDDIELINPYNPDSHLEEFYKEVKLRQFICEEEPQLAELNEVLGLTREMVIDYLSPVTVVDGQHRLLSANEALEHMVEERLTNEDDSFIEGLAKYGSASSYEKSLRHELRRTFSATVICDDDWAEHVFQFVVVNQKVNPISKNLLSSIIGTSLNSSEIEQIQSRLERAGIEIDDYKVMSRLVEDPVSPFYGRVKKGYSANKREEKYKLDWSALNNMARDFKLLKKLQPADRTGDYNFYTEWKNSCLKDSKIITSRVDDEANWFEVWGCPVNGVWIDVFLKFFSVVKDKFSDENNDLTSWSNPNVSNLYNAATLRALLSDFGEYLQQQNIEFDDLKSIDSVIDDYFNKTSKEFFARPWKILGKRMDKVNREMLARCYRYHRATGKVDGKQEIFKKK